MNDEAGEHADGYHPVEPARVARFALKTRLPTHSLGEGIARGACQYRHANQADTENPQCKEHEREVTRKWAKRARRLCCGVDVDNSRYVERDGGRQDDEVGREIGIEHAAPGVPAYAAELRGCGAPVAQERGSSRRCLHVLHFFGRLPEEQIGADGRAEDPDHDGGGGRVRSESRPDCPQCHLPPGDVNREEDCGVGKQGQGKPL